MSGQGFNSGLEDQKIEFNLYKAGVLAAIIILAVSSIYFFQRSQTLAAQTDQARSQLSEARTQLEDVRSDLEETNETLQFVQQRNSEIKQENGELRMIADRPLVTVEYRARTNSQSGLEVQIDATNYGNMTAEGIQASCNVFRQDSDQSYDSFSFSIDTLTNRTVRTVNNQVSLSQAPRNSDEIRCRTDSCEGLCQPLHEKIDQFYTNHPREQFN